MLNDIKKKLMGKKLNTLTLLKTQLYVYSKLTAVDVYIRFHDIVKYQSICVLNQLGIQRDFEISVDMQPDFCLFCHFNSFLFNITFHALSFIKFRAVKWDFQSSKHTHNEVSNLELILSMRSLLKYGVRLKHIANIPPRNASHKMARHQLDDDMISIPKVQLPKSKYYQKNYHEHFCRHKQAMIWGWYIEKILDQ